MPLKYACIFVLKKSGFLKVKCISNFEVLRSPLHECESICISQGFVIKKER